MSDSPNNNNNPQQVQSAVGIDYLAKDYASLRRLMLDRLNAKAAGAATGQPADPGTMLVELLAHAADKLSYYQDSVATEAYLGTARLRSSVRRHARLLDYPMHDGCNARAWVSIQVPASVDKQVLPAGTAILSRSPGQPGVIAVADIDVLQSAGAQVFETLYALTLCNAHNQLSLTGGPGATLPAGATTAALRNDGLRLSLEVGDVLIFEDIADASGPADPTLRCAVRLTSMQLGEDASGAQVVNIGWSTADALPFTLLASRTRVTGNIVLADHGYTLPQLEEVALAPSPLQRASLAQGPNTWQSQVIVNGQSQIFPAGVAASAAVSATISAASVLRPVLKLVDSAGRSWTPRRDLLGSGPHDTDFVVEVDDAGTTFLRFGDGVYGKYPQSDLTASYRVGNGTTGNVGAESLYHVVTTLSPFIYARNPMPASGGTDPEAIEKVQLHAPHYFQQQQQRAVTMDDYIAALRTLPEVHDARITRRYTGSWYTLMITVQRPAGQAVDAPFVAQLRQFLEDFRMVGHDLQISGPVEVPLDIALTVQAASGYSRSVVLDAVKAALGRGTSSGQPGFFHPDRCVLGQPLYLSQLVSATMAIPGISDVEVTRFQRKNGASALDAGVILLNPNEVSVVDNLPGQPESGQLSILVGGGT